MTSHNVDGVCAVVNNACGLLEQDFCGQLQTQLRLGFPTGYLDLTQAYNVLQVSYQQGKLQGGDQEKQKQNFLVRREEAADWHLERLFFFCVECFGRLKNSRVGRICFPLFFKKNTASGTEFMF